MDITQIFSTSGPLPQKFPVTIDQNIVQLLYVAGSCYTTRGDEMIGAQVRIDDDPLPLGTVSVFSNEKNSHKAMVAQVMPIKAAIGEHVLTLMPLPGSATVSDQNDVWTGSLLQFSTDRPFVWRTPGPVPQSTTLHSNVLGPAVLYFSASCWMDEPAMGGISAVLDGNVVGQSQLWFNESASHKALPPMMVPIDLTPGDHQIGFGLVTGNERTDGNDVFTMALLI